ncbi:hypothetical protein [Streptomyces regalis]|uniref:Uncharacterized protein n=1 Tax=Streptomyces regalis TaxID=68262 RepID=A0A0X3VDJ2_9ACTN|nr:hypothetical protein [Streptomyces regalis]KUL42800.1 hypothetical protein ADL12_09150 [Streptomyces regalis]
MTHTTTGIAHPATAFALAGFRRRAWSWLGGGLGAMVVGLMVGPPADEAGIGWLNDIAVFCVGGGPVAAVVGVAALVNYRRMRRALSAHPWIACSAVGIPPRQGNPRTVLRHPLTGDVIPLSVRTLPQRYHLANPDPGGVLWWCGDARTGGVLAQPGGVDLLWAGRTRTGRRRRRDASTAEREGLLNRPRPRQPQTIGGDQLTQGREPDLSYAAMAEAARRLAIADEDGTAPHREPDIRGVPWWRVPALLEISYVWPTVVNAAFAIAMALTWWLLGKDRDIAVPLILAVLSGFNALRFGHRMIRGMPGVKALVRAARVPVPVPKRYVLLSGPDDGLVLVLFAAHGGPDDPPEAAMEVNPPGPRRHPRRGMPPVVGTVDLHGWLDAGPVVVPWIEGRPLWPRHAYESVNLNDRQDRDYFAALVGGVGAKAT